MSISELAVRQLNTKNTYGTFHYGYCLESAEGVVVSLYHNENPLGSIFETLGDLEDALATISNDEVVYSLNRYEGKVKVQEIIRSSI